MKVSEMSAAQQAGAELEKDTSVSDARWMLACVMFLAAAVFALGLVAEMTIATPGA